MVVAVTVLTSIDWATLGRELMITMPLESYVVHLAKMAQDCCLDGVVCSGYEIEVVHRACGKQFVTVVPSARSAGVEQNDQKRVMTPNEAVELGADYLVVGREISEAADPESAYKNILNQIGHGYKGSVGHDGLVDPTIDPNDPRF